jgi:hypothetical protein
MTNLTSDDARAIANVARVILNAHREIWILKSMFSTYAQDGDVPLDWEDEFEKLKKDERFCPLDQRYEALLVRFEQCAEQMDVSELIAKMPQGSLPS